jgi:hypothetical protein
MAAISFVLVFKHSQHYFTVNSIGPSHHMIILVVAKKLRKPKKEVQ